MINFLEGVIAGMFVGFVITLIVFWPRDNDY